MLDLVNAQAYAEKHAVRALLVYAGDAIALEHYAGGWNEVRAHALYSGTKAFWGVAAIEAEREGIIDLDDHVATLLPELESDARSEITLRMLLQMSAGYGFGGLGSAVPTFDRALRIALKHTPGTTFTYGGIPLQIFGAYFTRALAESGSTPHDYLRNRVLKPAGVNMANWRQLADGTHPFPTGAHLTARDWLAYGRYVMQRRALYARAFAASPCNARYGLGWWLGAPGAPGDLAYASGSGGQALYLAPSRGVAVVHFGASASYKHDAFLKRLFAA